MKKIALGDLGEFWYGDYKEPFEQLDGAVPGHPVGVVLKDDEGKVLCAYCGKTFDSLASHVKAHGMTGREYKAEVGLLKGSALVSERVRVGHLAKLVQRRDPRMGVHNFKGRTPIGRGSRSAEVGRNNGMWKAEYLNKTGRCYAQVLAVGRTVMNETGRLSEKELGRHGIHPNTVRAYFGDMDGYRRAVGLAPVNFHRWTDMELLGALRNLAMELGRAPSASDARRYGLPAVRSYQRAFGSWADAHRRAGLIPNLPVPHDNLDLSVLVAYATLGNLGLVARHLHVRYDRAEEVFSRYGAPFAVNTPHGRDSSMRREWAADMARRLSGSSEGAAA
jgi:hypothetical protein